MTAVDILVAAKKLELDRCPIKPISTKLTRGMPKLDIKIGIDNLNK